MAEFIDAALTQEVVDAKNELQQQADRAKVIVDYWDGLVPNDAGIPEAPVDGTTYGRRDAAWIATAAGGDMTKSVYDRIVLNNHSTGIYTGGEVSINVDTTKFDVAAGSGSVVDSYTNAGTPVYTQVVWGAFTGVVPTHIATSEASFVYINSAGAIVQDTVTPTPALRRENIYLSSLRHLDGVNIIGVSNRPEVLINPTNQMGDFFDGLGLINLDGNQVLANGVNLNIDKTAGEVHARGINYLLDKKQPNIRALPADLAATFFYSTQAAVTPVPVTLIDPTNYDVAGTITLVGGGVSTSTNQRVYLTSDGQIAVQYGQTTYGTLTEAITGVSTEGFVVEPTIKDGTVLIGIISMRRDATDLSDITEAKFTAASKFGEVSVGTGSSSVSSLQNAYDNSTAPQIVTDVLRGALAVKRGTALDTDVVTQVENGVGTVVHSITGEGKVKFADATVQETAFTPALKTKLDGVATGAQVNKFDFNDAVSDGNQYVRRDGAWEFAQAGVTGLYEAVPFLTPITFDLDSHTSNYLVSGDTLYIFADQFASTGNGGTYEYPWGTVTGRFILLHDKNTGKTIYGKISIGSSTFAGFLVSEAVYNDGFTGTSNVNADMVCFLSVEQTHQQDEPTWTDIIGDPANIAATFPNGVEGKWIPIIPDGVTPFILNKRIDGSTAAMSLTVDNGVSFTPSTVTVDVVENTVPALSSVSVALDTYGFKQFINVEETVKLNKIEALATANSTDAVLLARANHTGTQLAATVSDFEATVSANTSVTANTAKVSFPEAPSDGTQYARKDAVWEAIPAASGQDYNLVVESYTDLLTHASIAAIGVGDYSIQGSASDTTGGLPMRVAAHTFSVSIKYNTFYDTYVIEATLYRSNTASTLNSQNYGRTWFRSVSPTVDTGWIKQSNIFEGTEQTIDGNTYSGLTTGLTNGLISTGDNFVNSADFGLASGSTNSIVRINSLFDGLQYHMYAQADSTNPIILARTYIRKIDNATDTGWVQTSGT